MLETLTQSGAVIHTDPADPRQTMALAVAVAAFGGVVSKMEVPDTEESGQ